MLHWVRELFDDSVSDMDIADVWSTLGHQGLIAANSAEEITNKNVNGNIPAVVPGDINKNDQIIRTYGYKDVTATDSETMWDQLGYDYYGQPPLGSIIALYNNPKEGS